MGKIHFFTGKGGVGKSTLALSKAIQLSKKGHKTLLVEFSQFNTLSRHLKTEVGFSPVEYRDGLFVASWNGEDCLKEYVKHSVKIRFIFEMFFRSQSMHSLIKAAPALKEISFLGYLTSHFREVKPQLEFDHIVVDAPSTGHFISCFDVPQALMKITDRGPMGEHCRGILEVLKDSKKTQIVSVFLPEPLVVQEQQQLQNTLKEKFQIKPQVILNRSYKKSGFDLTQLPISEDVFLGRYFNHLKDVMKVEVGTDLQLLKVQSVFPEVLATNFVEVAEALAREMLWEEES